MAVSDKKFNEMMIHNKMLENQNSQLAKALKYHARPSSLHYQGLDPKIPVNAIVTRNGKVFEESLPSKSKSDKGANEVLVEDEGDGTSLSEVMLEPPKSRRTCDAVDTVNLTENYSAIIMNKMPTKLKDLGNFSIPYAIYKMQIDNAFFDLGDSVSLTPYTVYQRFELGELLPTNITLQLADRSIKFPKGKVEDVPLRVGKFVILVDFVVLEMDEDANIPIILGRPFLATLGAMTRVLKFHIK
ncbi:uncharacterized protein LOC110706498 [Chenopodium quinoa]|uniref:uncharacterized protein LOC110706498 n=1 Tax=Chenopodium quinoa TaxID=63459 RepID=UPI000B798DCD|nr:uncharacterized protein LOC110706498 [Chenopodium quinoa]